MMLSVLLPVYNAGSLLESTIQSILDQDFQHFEFLIINDASTDDSAKIIARFSALDPRIRVVDHPKNIGLSATLNEGLRLASFPLVARIDQDDIALPSRLGVQYNFMKSRQSLAAAGSYVYHMGINRKYDRLIRLPTDAAAIRQQLPSSNCLYHPSVILDRDKVMAIGGYRSEFKNAEDYDLWLRLSRIHDLANIPIPLLRYRFSLGGMTFGRKWEQLYYAFLAQAAHQAPDAPFGEVESAAKRVYEGQNKRQFLTMVAESTALELHRLGYEFAVISLLRRYARDIGWKKAIQIAVGIFKYRNLDEQNLKLFPDAAKRGE